MDRVLLTDGGHYENLGVFELLRRKCTKIIAFDAGEDPEWKLEDINRLVFLASKDRAIKEVVYFSYLMN